MRAHGLLLLIQLASVGGVPVAVPLLTSSSAVAASLAAAASAFHLLFRDDDISTMTSRSEPKLALDAAAAAGMAAARAGADALGVQAWPPQSSRYACLCFQPAWRAHSSVSSLELLR